MEGLVQNKLYEYNTSKKYMQEINSKHNNIIDNIIKVNNIEDILKFKEESLKILDLEYEQYIDKIRKYNQYIDVIKDIKYCLKNTNINPLDIIIKFDFDKEKNLICLFCDYRNHFDFKPNINNYQTLEIYVLYGQYHKTKRKMERLNINMSYEIDDEKITLNNLVAGKKRRCGHGTFALQNLHLAINNLNNLINKYNKRFGEKIRVKRYVDGIIMPIEEKIKKEDLIKFYDGCGYLNNGQIYKEFYN